jgi:hypothetical protein
LPAGESFFERAGLDAACVKALRQIEDKKYAAKRESCGYKDILKYGIGFYKKDRKVMKGEWHIVGKRM